MILTKATVIRWSYNNKKHYMSKGYKFTEIGDEFNCKIEDALPNSQSEIAYMCDYCLEEGKKIIKSKTISRYVKEDANCIIHKQACSHCYGKKEKEIAKKKQEMGLLKKGDNYYWSFKENRLKELNGYIIANKTIDNLLKDFKPLLQAIKTYNDNLIDMIFELNYNIQEICSNLTKFHSHLNEKHIIKIFKDFINKYKHFPSNEEIHNVIKLSYYSILRFGGIKHIKELLNIKNNFNNNISYLSNKNIKDLYEYRHKSGIYKITNIVQNKVYIGQAINLWERIRNGYINALPKNRNHNIHLQRAWNKYGEENFTIEIIELCKINELDDKEQYWIDYYKSYDNQYGYNICREAGSCRGMKNSKKEIERKRKDFLEHNPMKGKKQSKEVKQLISKINSIPIIQFDLKGNYIKEWDSTRKAAKGLNVKPTNISSVISKKSLTCGGYIFCKKKDYENGTFDINNILNKITYNKEHHHLSVQICQFDLNNNLIKEWNSITEAATLLNMKKCTISAVLTGRQKTSGGFIWKYKNNK